MPTAAAVALARVKTSKAVRLTALAAIAVVATLAAIELPSADSGVFLTQELGRRSPSAPLLWNPAKDVRVTVTKAGYAVERNGQRLVLSSLAEAPVDWNRHVGGFTRETSYGQEVLTVDPLKTELYHVVRDRQGPRLWRWSLRTSSKPGLTSTGAVALADGGLRIRPVQILDALGRDVTPEGLRWSLAGRGSDWQLLLSLDDAELPLPYLIDPAIDYPSPFYLSNTAMTGNVDLWKIVKDDPGTGAVDSTTKTRYDQTLHARDTFSRTVAASADTIDCAGATECWGNVETPSGVHWDILTGGFGFQRVSVNGTEGVMTFGANSTAASVTRTNQATIGADAASLAATDVDATMKFRGTSGGDTRSTYSFELQLRRSNATTGSYRFRVDFTTTTVVGSIRNGDGSLSFVPATTMLSNATNQPSDGDYYLRAQAIGPAGGSTALRMKLWRAGSAEPSAWNLTATHATGLAAGTVGIRTIWTASGCNVGGACTAGEARIDDLNVIAGLSADRYIQLVPGTTRTTLDSSVPGASDAPVAGSAGWIVDAGDTGIVPGSWTFTFPVNNPGSRFASGNHRLVVGMWKGTYNSGTGVFTPDGGPIVVPATMTPGSNFRTATGPGTASATVAGVPAIQLTSSQKLFVQAWFLLAASNDSGSGGAINSVADNDRTTEVRVNQTSAQITHPAADDVEPTVSSINLAAGTPSNAASVDFTVSFNESVTGVGTDDFALTTTGSFSTAPTITSVSADSGSTRTVTVNTGAGDGTIRLDLADDDSIVDLAGNVLGGAGDNADFTTGQTYTINGPSGSDPQPTAASAGPGEGGSLSNGSFTATWTSSTFSDDVKLVLDPDPAGPIPGLQTIGMRLSVRVFLLSDNSEITSLADTLKVLLGTGPAGSGVAFSDNGVDYAQLGEVFSEDLAPGTDKAFFTRPDATKVLMLRTLTFFVITKTGGFVAPAPPSAVGLGGLVEFGTLVLRWTSSSDPDGISSYELWVDDQQFAVLGGVQYETRIAPFDANDMRVFHIRAVDGTRTPGPPSNKVRVVPNVTGLAEADARAALVARGFAVETTIESADAPAGQVVSQDPASPKMVDVGSTVRLVVGAVPQGRALFTMQIANTPRIVIGRQKVLNVRVAVTEPARVRASLSTRLTGGKRWFMWWKDRTVQAGATIVKFPLPKNLRQTGTYVFRVRAESVATGEVTHRSTQVSVVTKKPARPMSPPLEVVVVKIGDEPEVPTPTLDLDERFKVSEAAGDAVFEVTTETPTEVEVVVIDADAEGAIELIAVLRLVYPDLAIVAVTSRENVGKATRAGATVELMKPVSPGLLAAVIERLAGG